MSMSIIMDTENTSVQVVESIKTTEIATAASVSVTVEECAVDVAELPALHKHDEPDETRVSFVEEFENEDQARASDPSPAPQDYPGCSWQSPRSLPRQVKPPRTRARWRVLVQALLLRLQDNRLQGVDGSEDSQSPSRRRKKSRRRGGGDVEDGISYEILKRVLNVVFVSIGILLLLSVIFVIVYTAIVKPTPRVQSQHISGVTDEHQPQLTTVTPPLFTPIPAVPPRALKKTPITTSLDEHDTDSLQISNEISDAVEIGVETDYTSNTDSIAQSQGQMSKSRDWPNVSSRGSMAAGGASRVRRKDERHGEGSFKTRGTKAPQPFARCRVERVNSKDEVERTSRLHDVAFQFQVVCFDMR